MTSPRRSAVVALLLLAGAAHAAPQLVGEVVINVPPLLEGRSTPGGDLVVQWRVEQLLGEPLVLCRAAWVVSPVWMPSTFIANPGCNTPAVRAQVQLLRGEVELVLTSDKRHAMVVGGEKVVIRCDVGAPNAAFRGSVAEFRKLPRERRKPHFSYNVFGAVPWARLFVPPLSEEQARAIVKGGFSVLGGELHRGVAHRSRLVAGEFADGAVASCAARLKREDRERELARLRARQLRLRQAARPKKKPPVKVKQASGDAFWDRAHDPGGAPAEDESGDGFFDAPSDPFTVQESGAQAPLVAQIEEARAAEQEAAQRAAEQLRELEARRGGLAGRLTSDACARIPKEIEDCALLRCDPRPLWRAPDPEAVVFNCDARCYQERQEAWNRQWGEVRRADRAAFSRWEACLAPARKACAPPGFTDIAACTAQVQRIKELGDQP